MTGWARFGVQAGNRTSTVRKLALRKLALRKLALRKLAVRGLRRVSVVLSVLSMALLKVVLLEVVGGDLGRRAMALCPSQLPDAIEAITSHPTFERARWGVLVQPLTDPSSPPLYAQAADQYFVPASNVKLLTTAAALAHLGPDFRVRTSIYDDSEEWAGEYPNSRQEPDVNVLRVVGQGDPSITMAGILALAQQVNEQGIQHIDRLIVDDHYFQGSSVNPTWEWEDVQAGYGAPVNSLILNQNEIVVHLYPQAVGRPLQLEWANPSDQQGWQVVNRSTTVNVSEPEWIRVGRDLGRPILYIDGQLRTGANRDVSAVSIPQPSQYFAEQLRQALNQVGVSVAAVMTVGAASASSGDVNGENLGNGDGNGAIASLPSLPFSDWLQWANRDSNNLATESLLLQLGVHAGQSLTEQNTSRFTTTLATGLSQLSQTLTHIGVDPTGYSLADGSGLSRHNLISPRALVETLQAMSRHPLNQMYRESLAIAATTGTLRYRFRDTTVAGQLYGKSGGLTGVAALSGYLYPPNYPPLIFSIVLNHSTQSGRVNRSAIDDVVLQLAQLQNCGEN